ncbi:MAG: hypothetical protein LUF82_07115 [Clostridia bacterium]|nr:hypothetical protein [Clostridia bacterium]
MLLLYILFGVYILAVNFYAVMLIKSQKDESGGDQAKMHTGDGKLILCALLGGAVGIYVSMFVMKYRLKNMMLMILMPVIAVLNIYFMVIAFKSGFTFIAV